MSTEPPDDPVYLHARREAVVIVGLWFCAMLWVIPYCYMHGYHPVTDPMDIETVWGIPSWVFWGIAVPWLVCDVIAIGLCLFFIKEDDLGEAPEATGVAEEQRQLHEGDLAK